MAFPGIYNINYYKGDTYEFRIYPKNSNDTAFLMNSYDGGGGTYDDDGNPLTPEVNYENVMFVFAETRESANWHKCLAYISTDSKYVHCVIRPEDSEYLDPTKTYVYDVQIAKSTTPDLPDGVPNYPQVHTLLTGTISVTGQVTP